MSKQTAVEWLAERCGLQALEDVIEEAKQMEKEQMENVFKEAQECAVKYYSVYFKYESFDKLYNETYGGNNE